MADKTTDPARSYSTEHNTGGHEPDEDPLVELARIVSDDGSFFQNAPAKPAFSAESGANPDSFSADLEAELMEEFETSFARQAAGPADGAAAGAPAQADHDLDEYASYAESDSQALGAIAAGAAAQTGEAAPAEYDGGGTYDAAAADDLATVAGPGLQAGTGMSGEQFSEPLADYPENPAIEPAIEPAFDFEPVQKTSPTASDRATAAAATGEPLPNSFEMEFAEALADTVSPPITEDFTPEFGVEAYGRDPASSDDQISAGGWAADEADYPDSHYAGDDAVREADDIYESGTAMPPPAPARTGGRKGLIAVLGVLAVVVIGGGVAAYIAKITPKDTAAPAPVIKAESGPVKVIAEASDTAGTAPSVLDQLAGQQAKSEEKLIDRIEEPQQIARVVLPGPDRENITQLTKPVGGQSDESSGSATDAIAKTIDRVMAAPQQPSSAPRYDPIGPRKVRTVVVKPDGSFVSSNEALAPTKLAKPATSTLPPLETMEVAAVNSAPSPKPTSVKTMEINSVPAPGETAAISGSADTSDRQASALQPTQVANVQPLAPVAGASDAIQSATVPVGLIPRPKPASVPARIVATAPVRQTARPASQSTKEPVNLLAAPARTDQPRVTASTAPTAAAAPARSGYVVQVSSQRSVDQAQASFESMKRRYKSVLGGFNPDIQRADLGAKGIYYRVRVGPMASRETALRLCEQLKSAGGSCFVTR